MYTVGPAGPLTVTDGTYTICDAGQSGAVHVTVELVGVSVWPDIEGGGTCPPVSEFHTPGGVLLVQLVTDKVEVPPGFTLFEVALIPPEQEGGGSKSPKFTFAASGGKVLLTGLGVVSEYPPGAVTVTL